MAFFWVARVYGPQLLGIFLLTAIYVAGTQLATALESSIPGAVFGLVACALAMLGLRDIQPHIRPGATVLLGLIPLFLVPVLSRMAVRIDFTDAAIWRAALVLSVASLAGVLATGFIAKCCLYKEPA